MGEKDCPEPFEWLTSSLVSKPRSCTSFLGYRSRKQGKDVRHEAVPGTRPDLSGRRRGGGPCPGHQAAVEGSAQGTGRLELCRLQGRQLPVSLSHRNQECLRARTHVQEGRP